jgi:linoleoyl-CoA desaturase
MRNKHLHIESDSKLLKEIRRRAEEDIQLNSTPYQFTLNLKLVVYFGLTVALYAALFFVSGAGMFILTYVLLGLTLVLLAFNFAHDFSHNTVFQNKKWNNFGFIGIYTLVGAHAEAWRERHINSHHFAPNVKEYDSDLQITSLIRVTPDMEYRWFHRFQCFYVPIAYSTYSLYWILIKDFTLIRQKIQETGTSFNYNMSFVFQKFFYLIYLLLLPLLFSNQGAWVVLFGFILMHMVQSVFLLITFFMTHHVIGTTYPETNENGIIQTSWLMNQVGSSNDMHPFSQSANFILGGFNNHIAHHLFPHVHHIHYPKLNRVLYQVLNENGIIPNQTSYVGGIVSHFKLLNKLSKKPVFSVANTA